MWQTISTLCIFIFLYVHAFSIISMHVKIGCIVYFYFLFSLRNVPSMMNPKVPLFFSSCGWTKFSPNQTWAEAHQPLAQFACTKFELNHCVSYQVTGWDPDRPHPTSQGGEIPPMRNNVFEESAIQARVLMPCSSW